MWKRTTSRRRKKTPSVGISTVLPTTTTVSYESEIDLMTRQLSRSLCGPLCLHFVHLSPIQLVPT